MRLFNYWRSSASYRVRLVLAHKDLPYEYVAVNLLKAEQHQPAHTARNPWGSVPVLEVEEGGRPLFLPQSVAIAEYLEERYPARPIFPSGHAARAQVRVLVEQVNSGTQPFQIPAVTNYIKDVAHADPKAWCQHWIRKGLGALQGLAERSAGRFLVGDDFTWADCCLVPQLYGARRFEVKVEEEFPLLARVEAAVMTLPAWHKARPEAQPDAQP